MNARELLFHLRRRIHWGAGLGRGKGGWPVGVAILDWRKRFYRVQGHSINDGRLIVLADAHFNAARAIRAVKLQPGRAFPSEIHSDRTRPVDRDIRMIGRQRTQVVE